jgi:putative membrane protein
MNDSPYNKFGDEDLILRDELALDRTLLANERTLLAYLRSAMALLIAGATMIHFSRHGWFWTLGLLCLPLGALVGLIGVVRYRRMNAAIGKIRRKRST